LGLLQENFEYIPIDFAIPLSSSENKKKSEDDKKDCHQIGLNKSG